MFTDKFTILLCLVCALGLVSSVHGDDVETDEQSIGIPLSEADSYEESNEQDTEKRAMPGVMRFGKRGDIPGVLRFGKRAIPGVMRFGKKAMPGVMRFGKKSMPGVMRFGKRMMSEDESIDKRAGPAPIRFG